VNPTANGAFGDVTCEPRKSIEKGAHYEERFLFITATNSVTAINGFFVNVPYPHNENECSSLIPGK